MKDAERTKDNSTLEEWHRALKKLAEEKGFGWIVSESAEDYAEGYNDGYDVEGELSEQIHAAADSM